MSPRSEGDSGKREEDRRLHVVLVHPEIHWNTGNAGRTCLAAGASLHLVEPLGFSLEDSEVRRAGLDYWPRVRPTVWPDWETMKRALPDLGVPFFFTSEAERPYWEVEYPARTVLLFGRESEGLPDAIRGKYEDRTVGIPVLDREVRSLNLSTSVALGAYEVRRQWGEKAKRRKDERAKGWTGGRVEG